MSNSDKENVAVPPVDDDDDDDDDGINDITDVWDEEKLKAALGELRPDSAIGPATKASGEREASIQVDDGLRQRQRGPEGKVDTDPPPGAGSGGLSWPVTIGLALSLGVAVYLLVTLYLK